MLRKITSYLYLILLFVFFYNCLLAQKLSTKHYSIINGLIQNETQHLLIDHQRHIWITTENSGIMRFNGQEIKGYAKRQGLSNNYVTGIVKDNDNFIWIATQNGLNRFDGQKFEHYLTDEDKYANISTLTIDSAGQIWFFQKNKGLGIIDNERRTIFIDRKEWKNIQPLAMIVDQEQLWLSTSYQGIIIYDLAQDKVEQIDYRYLPFTKVYNFLILADKTLLLATNKGIFARQDGRFKQKSYLFSQNRPIYTIYEDSKKNIWASTFLGIYHVDKAENSVHFYDKDNGLSNSIYSVIEDVEGGLWFTSSEGLFRLNNQVFKTYTKDDGLLDEHISYIGISNDSSIWFCTNSGLGVFDVLENIRHIKHPALNNFPGPLAANPKRPEVYVFGENGHLYVKKNRRFSRVNNFRKDKPQWAVLSDDGILYLSGGFGVAAFNGKSYVSLVSSEDLNNAEVNALVIDKTSNLWIGTEGTGLFRYKDGKIENIDVEHFLPNKVVTSILVDSKNNLWFGTRGNGIFKIHNYEINRSDLKIIGFEEKELASDNIVALNEDFKGNIWVATSLGISKIISLEQDLIVIESYKKDEGLQQLEIYPNTMVKSMKKKLWVGTIGGLISINSTQKIYPNIPPHIRINNIKLFFENINWKKRKINIDRWASLPTEKVYFSYKDNHFAFDFVAISFNVPEKIEYQWWLEGLEDQWTPLSHRREAIYSNLSHGNYIFRVRACNGGNICSQTASFNFKIAPPVHKTPYATISIVLSLLFLVYLFVKRQVKNLKKSQGVLEQRVKERTMEIESKKAEIEYQSQQLTKAFKQIDQRNQELTNINQDINKSIDFASKIQKAFFVSEKTLKQYLPSSFLLSIPRNVITSDFIWVHHHEKYLYVALADCTGSGVSGAFLGLIGNMCLNDTVKGNIGLDPASLLKLIHKAMINILEAKEVEINTAMDLALCKIDLEKKELIFSGAKRPIIYIQDGTLNIIKGSFFSTGITYKNIDPHFENKTIICESSTHIYLFSDGFPNQLGGSNKTKYKISNFKKLLQSLHEENMDIQATKLRKEFYSWFSGNMQTDDVLIVGFNLFKLEQNLENDFETD